MRALLANVFCLSGMGLASYGAWLVAPWAMFCLLGFAITWLGVWLRRRSAAKKPETGAPLP